MSRNLAALWLAAAFFPCMMNAADAPLPAWGTQDRKALEASGWLPGLALLVEEPPLATDLQKLPSPSAEELREDPAPLKPLPEADQAAYFAERPKSFFVDPRGLVPAAVQRERVDFLNYHSGDSSIDLFIYLFRGDEEIPSEVRQEEMMERLFSQGKQAVVIFYYVGAPQRATLHLSPSLLDSVPLAEQRGILQSAVMRAAEKFEPGDQLEAFCEQSSIRIYWIERKMGRAQNQDGIDPELTPAPVRKKKPSFMDRHGVEIQALATKWVPPIVSGFVILAIGWLAIWLDKRRTSHRFPERKVEPRLGAPHAAGVGAVISFSRSSLPPSLQREQLPDYLRRK